MTKGLNEQMQDCRSRPLTGQYSVIWTETLYNRLDGHRSKTLRTSFGDVEMAVPRDRKGEFEPQVLKKSQISISQDIEEKFLAMYAKGITTSDIEAHIQDIYGVVVFDTTVSCITDKILPIAKEWQQRPLEAVSTRWCFWTPFTTMSAARGTL